MKGSDPYNRIVTLKLPFGAGSRFDVFNVRRNRQPGHDQTRC